MNKTGEYIQSRKDVLSVYFTAGYPARDSTKEIILALQDAGADLIEVGIPYSDPLADGPVIQRSGEVALQNGFTLKGLFEDLKTVQPQLKIPLVLMGYFNTAFAFGIESFLSHCQQINIDTVILPDLPVNIYVENYKDLFAAYGVSPVFLISPQTDHDRITVIDSVSNAFIYVVSDSSITGASKNFSNNQMKYFKTIKNRQLKAPQLLGFGIHNRESFKMACGYFNGAIIGSAFIRSLGKADNISESVTTFIDFIKQGN